MNESNFRTNKFIENHRRVISAGSRKEKSRMIKMKLDRDANDRVPNLINF